MPLLFVGYVVLKSSLEHSLYPTLWLHAALSSIYISSYEGWVLWFWSVSLPHPPSPDYTNVQEPYFNPHIHRSHSVVLGVQSTGQEKFHANNILNAHA